MAKRSPILGFNHNVRYRGLVFHVQTEDSGVLAPHLFTHLFHTGVIVSTRKYVYDSGSTEEAIRSLMQAQHKAVLKDLKRGHFDDKIDQYLGGTPGLLPRDGGDPTDPAHPMDAPLARASQGLPAVEPPEDGNLSIGREATIEQPPLGLRPTEPAVEPPAESRTRTPVKASAPTQVRTSLPAEGTPEDPLQSWPDDFATSPVDVGDSQPEIMLELEVDEPDDDVPVLRRSPLAGDSGPWDPLSDGVPGALPGPPTIRNPGEATGPVASGAASLTGPLSQRAAKAVGAASLPPARPIARPASRPAMVPPQVVSRPLPADDRRTPPPNDAIEVYAPAPPSAELPGAPAPERPGQYSQHKKISSRIPSDADLREGPRPLHPQQSTIPQIMRPGSSPAIPQPVRQSATSQITQPRVNPSPVPLPPRTGTPPPVQRATPPAIPVPARTGSPQQPRAATPPPVEKQPSRPAAAVAPQRLTPIPSPAVRPPADAPRSRTPTPQRVSVTTPSGGSPAVAPGRAGTPNRDSAVVMTRPAVIVGAPAKSAPSTQRVRKAREDEGRGFGQGLISEKSLDEVILAYLSEDGEDK